MNITNNSIGVVRVFQTSLPDEKTLEIPDTCPGCQMFLLKTTNSVIIQKIEWTLLLKLYL